MTIGYPTGRMFRGRGRAAVYELEETLNELLRYLEKHPAQHSFREEEKVCMLTLLAACARAKAERW